jgi:hypothetical protein
MTNAAPEFIAGLGLGETPLTGSPANFGRHVVAETDKWAKDPCGQY